MCNEEILADESNRDIEMCIFCECKEAKGEEWIIEQLRKKGIIRGE